MNFIPSLDNVNQIEASDPAMGTGGIHLGNWHGAMDKNYLLTHRITHVVSALPENLCEIPELKELKIIQLCVPCEDSEHFNIYDALHTTADFIDDATKKGNVMVHCAAGISRSTTQRR